MEARSRWCSSRLVVQITRWVEESGEGGVIWMMNKTSLDHMIVRMIQEATENADLLQCQWHHPTTKPPPPFPFPTPHLPTP